MILFHTFHALDAHYPDINKGGFDVSAHVVESNGENFEVSPSERAAETPTGTHWAAETPIGATREKMVKQWRESLRAWERSLRKERANPKGKRNMEAPQRRERLHGKRVKAELGKSKTKKLKPQKRTFFKSSEPEPHYDHYDIFGYPGDHYYPHFMDYDDFHDYDYDKDDVDHGNFFVDQFHDLLDFFF